MRPPDAQLIDRAFARIRATPELLELTNKFRRRSSAPPFRIGESVALAIVAAYELGARNNQRAIRRALRGG